MICYGEGCDRVAVARGLCMKHYKRFRRYGDPNGRFRRPSLRERFQQKYLMGAAAECWNWAGAIKSRKQPYGAINRCDGTGAAVASRVAWELARGPIPNGLWVLHHCDNPRCVNPDHLFLGTAQDNVDDMIAKGRQVMVISHHRTKHNNYARGENHHAAKITAKQASEIRARISAGARGKDLAHEYGVSEHIVSRIKLQKNWISV